MMIILLLFLPAFVYLKTLPPSILWVDSGTMVAAAYSLGIPNPPGFPTYIMASHLFTLLPFGTVLFRMQLFTVVFAVLTILLLYRIILLVLQLLNLSVKTFKARLSAAFGSIALAFSYEFWSQTHNTDAFMFTDFLLVLILYLILKIQLNRTNKQKVFYGFLLVAVVFGLAAGANPTISLFVPSTLFALYLNKKFLTVKGLAVQFALFGLLAVTVYSYLPLRAGQYPPVNWNNPQTLAAVLRHISGSGLNVYAPGSDIVNGFTGSPLIFLQSLTYFVWFGLITSKLYRLIAFAVLIILLPAFYGWYLHPETYFPKQEFDQIMVEKPSSEFGYFPKGVQVLPDMKRVPDQGAKKILDTFAKKSWQVEVQYDTSFNTYVPYFPGWVALVDGKMVDPKTDSEYATIEVPLKIGQHEVKVEYRGTGIQYFSNRVSILAILTLAGLLLIPLKTPDPKT